MSLQAKRPLFRASRFLQFFRTNILKKTFGTLSLELI
jgi:hypothetical protein